MKTNKNAKTKQLVSKVIAPTFVLFFAFTLIISFILFVFTENKQNYKSNIECLSAQTFINTLAQTKTPIKSKNQNRTENIFLTCKMINEQVVMPNALFSFNQAVGSRTAERGFKPAPVFINGKVSEGVGGGVCQVSSTLYYACLLADFEIISRTSHAMIPDYLEKPGLDATLWYGAIDFVFKNNTPTPVKILSWVENNQVHVKIMGTKTNDYKVVIESKIISTTPAQLIYVDNPSLAPGESRVVQHPFTGYVVETYRVIKDAQGNEISRSLEARSTYRKVDKIIERASVRACHHEK